MTSADILLSIKLSGKAVEEIRDANPHALRGRLYKAAKRRGYNWRFAVVGGKVYVYVKG